MAESPTLSPTFHRQTSISFRYSSIKISDKSPWRMASLHHFKPWHTHSSGQDCCSPSWSNTLTMCNFVLLPATEETPMALSMAAIVPAISVPRPDSSTSGSMLKLFNHHCGSEKLYPIVEVVVILLVQLSAWPQMSGCLISRPLPMMQIFIGFRGFILTRLAYNKLQIIKGKDATLLQKNSKACQQKKLGGGSERFRQPTAMIASTIAILTHDKGTDAASMHNMWNNIQHVWSRIWQSLYDANQLGTRLKQLRLIIVHTCMV